MRASDQKAEATEARKVKAAEKQKALADKTPKGAETAVVPK
jgi:hypothetical protein